MQVAKWGNSLAIRLPKALVDQLALKPGDDLKIVAAERNTLEVTKGDARAQALAMMKSLQRPLPADYKFDRDEANSR